MLLRKRTVLAIALAGVSVMAGPGMAQAADSALPPTMKPMQAVIFDVGTKRAVSFFLIEDHVCKLILTLGEKVHDNEVNDLTAARIIVPVEVGKIAYFDTVDGKSMEFKCLAGAQAMRIEVSNCIASY